MSRVIFSNDGSLPDDFPSGENPFLIGADERRKMEKVDPVDLEIAEAYDELDDIDRLADEDPLAHEEVYEEIEKGLSRERGRGKKF